MDQQKLQEVMVELAVYCNSQATLSTAVKGKPAPGAACCAQFSGGVLSNVPGFLCFCLISVRFFFSPSFDF